MPEDPIVIAAAGVAAAARGGLGARFWLLRPEERSQRFEFGVQHSF